MAMFGRPSGITLAGWRSCGDNQPRFSLMSTGALLKIRGLGRLIRAGITRLIMWSWWYSRTGRCDLTRGEVAVTAEQQAAQPGLRWLLPF
jgi:hypothetical protein